MLAIAALAAVVSCNKTAENTNKPVIIQGWSFTADGQSVTPAGNLQIAPGQVLTIKVNFVDPDAGASPDPSWYSFTWAASRMEGTSSQFNPNVNFIASDENPMIWNAPSVPGFYKFTCQVRDHYGAVSMQDVVVEVNSNKKPVISELDVSKTDPFVNEEVTLTVDANDPDGNLPLEYVWQANGGFFTTETDNVAKWLSPTSGTFQITIVVNDQAGGSTSRTVPINVQANHAPVIEGWNLDPGGSVSAGGLVTITLNVTDEDGDVLEFNWSSNVGTFNSVDKNVASWRAPATAGPATVTCVINDQKGGSDTANINITVI
jgi:hypothetical protein